MDTNQELFLLDAKAVRVAEEIARLHRYYLSLQQQIAELKAGKQPTTTTTVSETRPVSALEQTLRDKANECIKLHWNGYEVPDGRDCLSQSMAYKHSADLIHARDAQLWALYDYLDLSANKSERPETLQYARAYHDAADRLRAILEGKTS